jgi:sulfate permease, SulP family
LLWRTISVIVHCRESSELFVEKASKIGGRVLNASFSNPFIPKLWTVLHEDYGKAELRGDVAAGLTVTVVALPLSMAVAIASGVTPDRGLYTAIISGFIVSAFGGGRFQIGGTGAFIVLVLTTVQAHGVDGLITATMLSGVIMASVGYLRLGTIINFMPYPVTGGFHLRRCNCNFHEPDQGSPRHELECSRTRRAHAKNCGLDAGAAKCVFARSRDRRVDDCNCWPLPKVSAAWPGMVVVSFLGFALNMPVDTIGSRFGGIPQTLPVPRLPLA